MKSIYTLAFTAIIATSLIQLNSCKEKEEDPDPTPQTGAFQMEFEPYWVSKVNPFVFGTNYVHPKTGDTLNFGTLKFYVSNIGLQKTDDTWWNETESYHLLDAGKTGGNLIDLKGIPAGSYKAIRYTLGVDSLRNVSGAQSGALSPSEGMFWSWNNGYIMVKAEGMSPQSTTGDFAFHLGGFSGENNIVTVKTASFTSEMLDLNPDAKPVVHFTYNAARFWHSSPSVGDRSRIHMPGAAATLMARDFNDGFAFDHIHK